MLQWGRASPDQCGQGERSGHPVPGLGTSRLLGQGTWFGVQMGILVSQGPQGDCSRAPTEIHRLGSVVWHVGAPRIAPQMGIQWTGGYSANSTSLSVLHLPPRSNL